MTFNVEYGGELVDFEKVVEAVRAADADVVALEEPYGNARRLADALGFGYASRRSDVISRFPLIDPPDSDGRHVWVEVQPEHVVAIANVHLPSDPYGPYFTRRCPTSSVLQLERETRLPAIAPLLERLRPLVESDMPVFVLGDFNAPSHRDWTAATVGARPQNTAALAWPVSTAVEAAGFTDSYRDVHPDPVAKPGLTWWAARPEIEAEFPSTDPQDRIDLIYAAGAARARDSQIIGEPGAPDVDIPVTPWPSDHRAVVSELSVVPAQVPVFVSVDERLVTIGDALTVRFGRPENETGSIVLVPQTAPANTPPIIGTLLDAAGSTLQFGTAALEAGAYEVRLLADDAEVLSSAPVWLKAPETAASIGTDAAVYAPGAPIGVRWENAPGNRWDWVSVYRAPADPAVDEYLVWSYLSNRVEGSLVLDAEAQGGQWPLEPGDYEAVLLLYDAYDVAARVSFRVAGAPVAEASPPAAERPWDADCQPDVAVSTP